MEEHSSPAVEDTGALDYVLCLLPLKPPIFMCGDGHVVVCAPCRDELVAVVGSKCHACGIAADGYRRCHAMERVVESARVPCRNIAHDCTTRPLYYEVRAHQETCAHGSCRCPFKACGFVGSTAALWDHITVGIDCSCWDQPSALAGIDRRLLLGSIVDSCWDRPSALAGIDRRN
jgi:E3 ubiquitin-protein ligase SIAH1